MNSFLSRKVVWALTDSGQHAFIKLVSQGIDPDLALEFLAKAIPEHEFWQLDIEPEDEDGKETRQD